MAWKESLFSLSLLTIVLLQCFALAQPDGLVLKLINQDSVQTTFSTQLMNVHEEIDTYLGFKAGANIGGQQKAVRTTSIVKAPTEEPYLMDLQDTTSIPDRCLLLPPQSLSSNAIDSTTLYARFFSGPYVAIKSPLVQYFSSYTLEVIPKKVLFDLCFDRMNGFNKFPSITFQFTNG